MMLALLVGALAFVLGTWFVVRVSLRIMAALGLELMPVLFWLGLAEEPMLRTTKLRLGELLEA